MSEIGAKSRSGSKPLLGCVAGAMASTELAQASRVCPSGAARATVDAPMTPPAEGRFSTTTAWPRLSVIMAAMMRV